MAVRIVFIVCSVVAGEGRTRAAGPLYDGKRSQPFQSMEASAMSGQEPLPDYRVTEVRAKKPLTPAAERALAEAAARREAYLAREAALPKERGGRGGLEPGRYGDWEVKGLTADF
jgi:hypothetical protein